VTDSELHCIHGGPPLGLLRRRRMRQMVQDLAQPAGL
jgi:hypothetical protein